MIEMKCPLMLPCLQIQEDGKWNKFGGRLAWDKSYICNNNAAFGGTGSHKPQEDYVAAPNLDHSQERVRKDLTNWLRWLRNTVGFDGWRFDFVKGYGTAMLISCGNNVACLTARLSNKMFTSLPLG